VKSDEPKFFTPQQLVERWQLEDVETVYRLPIRRVKIGSRIRFPRAEVEKYESRPFEAGHNHQRAS
jgi:hypothetical protein